MQAYMQTMGLRCPGVPDATVFEHGAAGFELIQSLNSDLWNIRCLQVCRAYTRRHLNCMISEKVYKSSVWVAHMQLRKTTFACATFTIAVFVPAHLHEVAERIAGYANDLLASTIFRVQILVPPLVAERKMFKYAATNKELCHRRKLAFHSAGEVVTAHKLGKESVAVLYSAENEEEDNSLLFWLWRTDGS